MKAFLWVIGHQLKDSRPSQTALEQIHQYVEFILAISSAYEHLIYLQANSVSHLFCKYSSLANLEATVAGALTSLAALSSPTSTPWEVQAHTQRIDDLLQEVVSSIQVSAFRERVWGFNT